MVAEGDLIHYLLEIPEEPADLVVVELVALMEQPVELLGLLTLAVVAVEKVQLL